MGGFEILEHTADVGIRALGATLEECFEQATWALAGIIGIDRPGEGEDIEVALEASDLEGLLVDWLSEVLYLHDSRDAVLAGVTLDSVADAAARGTVVLAPRAGRAVAGTQVKAITYHRLRVAEIEDGFVAEVYLDV
jgi:SHS2 domain-containing protein